MISLQNAAPRWHSQPCRMSLEVVFDVLECSNRPADARNRSATRFCASLCLAGISWASLGCKVMSRQKWSEILMKSSLEIVIILKMFTKCSTFFTFEKCDWHVSFNFASFFRIHHKSEMRCQVERVLNSFRLGFPTVADFNFQNHFHFCSEHNETKLLWTETVSFFLFWNDKS